MSWLWWWRPPCLLRTVSVQFTHDESLAIEGVLWSARGPWLTLRRAQLLKAGSGPAALDGEVVVHRDQIAFLQVLPELTD